MSNTDTACATGTLLPYDYAIGGNTCAGCGRNFKGGHGAINAHVRAARKRCKVA